RQLINDRFYTRGAGGEMLRGKTRAVIGYLPSERNHAVFGGHLYVRGLQGWFRVKALLNVCQDVVVARLVATGHAEERKGQRRQKELLSNHGASLGPGHGPMCTKKGWIRAQRRAAGVARVGCTRAQDRFLMAIVREAERESKSGSLRREP